MSCENCIEICDCGYKVCDQCKTFCRFIGYDNVNNLRIPPISVLSSENVEKVRNVQKKQKCVIHILNKQQTERWFDDLNGNFRFNYAGDKDLCYFPYNINYNNYLWRCDSCSINYNAT